MKEKRYAAIDIGSNAVRLLIKRYDPQAGNDKEALKKLLLLRVPLRLGFDVFSKNKISPQKEENLLRLMKAYRQLMKIYDVEKVRACATSAMRDAENGPQIIAAIRKATGINIEIIPGEEEAAIVYNNHIECNPDRKGNYLYVDVGGGSTELNCIVDNELKASRSFNIGTVRILSGKVKESEWHRLNTFLEEIAAGHSDFAIIGSGGNINRLYKMASDEEKDSEEGSFSVDELAHIYHRLKPMSVEQRMRVFNMKADRADVIIPAAEIFLHIASVIKARRIIVPVIGVADGIIDGLFLADKTAEKEGGKRQDR